MIYTIRAMMLTTYLIFMQYTLKLLSLSHFAAVGGTLVRATQL